MVKLKNKYVLMELIFNEPGCVVTDSAIYAAICKELATMYGDFGIAAAKPSLSVKVFDPATGIVVVRISTESCNRLLSTIPFTRSISDHLVVLRVLFLGSSIRSCEKALLRINRKRLYAALHSATSQVEKKHVLEALRSVTGEVILK